MESKEDKDWDDAMLILSLQKRLNNVTKSIKDFQTIHGNNNQHILKELNVIKSEIELKSQKMFSEASTESKMIVMELYGLSK